MLPDAPLSIPVATVCNPVDKGVGGLHVPDPPPPTVALVQVTVILLTGTEPGQLANVGLVACTCIIHVFRFDPLVVVNEIVALALPGTNGASGSFAVKVIVVGVTVAA